MARRANWDKRYRMRLNIGLLGEQESVTITWEGNDAGAVRRAANSMVAAFNASLQNTGGEPQPATETNHNAGRLK